MQFDRCLYCMEETTTYPCPHCGYRPGSIASSEYALPLGSILRGKYLIGGSLGQGGFGITYAAFDLACQQKVAIKEYYPSGQVTRSQQTGTILRWYGTETAQQLQRSGMDSFMREARKMSLVANLPEVVHIRDVFQENNTAYIVMDFIKGRTLKTELEQKGPLTWQKAEAVFYPAIRAMSRVHQCGLIHRDLSPDNIMLRPDGSIAILDLGAAKDLTVNSGASSMLVAKSGFSPLEQYSDRGNSGAWTDVYAMAATIYYALTGARPQESFNRLAEDRLDMNHPAIAALPARIRNALKHALAVKADERTRSMDDFLKELTGSSDDNGKKPAQKKNFFPLILAAVVLLAGIAAGVWFGVHSWSDADCTNPRTCRICGKTDGLARGHSWTAATCKAPKTCTVCGRTTGQAADHSWAAASCTAPKTCTACGKTTGQAAGHNWKAADCENPQTCRVCGKTQGTAAGHGTPRKTVSRSVLLLTETTEETCPNCGKVIRENTTDLTALHDGNTLYFSADQLELRILWLMLASFADYTCEMEKDRDGDARFIFERNGKRLCSINMKNSSMDWVSYEETDKETYIHSFYMYGSDLDAMMEPWRLMCCALDPKNADNDDLTSLIRGTINKGARNQRGICYEYTDMTDTAGAHLVEFTFF